MAYSEELVRQIRIALEKFAEAFTEKEIFGGVVFLYKGKMTVGAINEDLMVRRTISLKIEEELENEHVPPWIFIGKPMKEFVLVAFDGYRTETQLQKWIELGLEHAKTKI